MMWRHILSCEMRKRHICLRQYDEISLLAGMNIRIARRQAGFTQIQLSEATGIDQASISRMENGKQSITLDYLKRIAGALGVPLQELVVDAMQR